MCTELRRKSTTNCGEHPGRNRYRNSPLACQNVIGRRSGADHGGHNASADQPGGLRHGRPQGRHHPAPDARRRKAQERDRPFPRAGQGRRGRLLWPSDAHRQHIRQGKEPLAGRLHRTAQGRDLHDNRNPRSEQGEVFPLHNRFEYRAQADAHPGGQVLFLPALRGRRSGLARRLPPGRREGPRGRTH